MAHGNFPNEKSRLGTLLRSRATCATCAWRVSWRPGAASAQAVEIITSITTLFWENRGENVGKYGGNGGNHGENVGKNMGENVGKRNIMGKSMGKISWFFIGTWEKGSFHGDGMNYDNGKW